VPTRKRTSAPGRRASSFRESVMVSETPDRGLPDRSAAEAEAALLAEHGILRVPADRFDVDGYRYTNAADAIAQARRTREARG
jgi:hypothetical protein